MDDTNLDTSAHRHQRYIAADAEIGSAVLFDDAERYAPAFRTSYLTLVRDSIDRHIGELNQKEQSDK